MKFEKECAFVLLLYGFCHPLKITGSFYHSAFVICFCNVHDSFMMDVTFESS